MGDADVWTSFRDGLAAAVAEMKPGHHLTMEIADIRDENPEVPRYCLQLVREGEQLSAEAISNHHPPDQWALSDTACQRLTTLGWMESTPQQGQDRTYHFARMWLAPLPHTQVADSVVDALREVYGVMTPGQLAYRHFDNHGQDFEANIAARHERAHLLSTIGLDPSGTITQANAAVDHDGNLVVNESVRDGMFTSLHDRWTLSSAAKAEILLRLLQEKFHDGESLAAWVQSLGVPFKHVSNYSGPPLERPR